MHFQKCALSSGTLISSMATFKIATCTVSYDGYAHPAGTPTRMALLSSAVSQLSDRGVELFSLPGGYAFASSNSHLNTLQRRLGRLAIDAGIDLVVGVDARVKTASPSEEVIRRGRLGAWAVYASRNGHIVRWRQRSTTRDNQRWVSDAVCEEERLVRQIPRVESLICGEIFNERIRAALIRRNTRLVIDHAHTSQGFRVFAAMKVLARSGVSSLCSVHADLRNAVKHCYVPGPSGRERRSSRETDLEIGSRPRLEIKVWTFDAAGRLLAD